MTWANAKIKRIYVGDKQVRPALIYDFTASDWWWVADSWVSRSSSWFYISESWDYKDKNIKAPSEIYNHWTPRKIIIEYSKSWVNTGTWLRSNTSPTNELILPRNPSNLNYLAYTYNGWTTQQLNLWANPTWNVTWELDIDSSTTNRTITHKITWATTVQESSWVLKYLFANKLFYLRLVHWTSTWLYIKSIKFCY